MPGISLSLNMSLVNSSDGILSTYFMSVRIYIHPDNTISLCQSKENGLDGISRKQFSRGSPRHWLLVGLLAPLDHMSQCEWM